MTLQSTLAKIVETKRMMIMMTQLRKEKKKITWNNIKKSQSIPIDKNKKMKIFRIYFKLHIF